MWACNLWVLIIYLLFLPAVRVFPGVWKLLCFVRLPSRELHPPLFCLPFYLLYFFLPPFEDNGLLFWVPEVLCRHSEVVLWNLLSVQMFFWWICGGESGVPVLFLHHLRTASIKVLYFIACFLIAMQYYIIWMYQNLLNNPFKDIWLVDSFWWFIKSPVIDNCMQIFCQHDYLSRVNT